MKDNDIYHIKTAVANQEQTAPANVSMVILKLVKNLCKVRKMIKK